MLLCFSFETESKFLHQMCKECAQQSSLKNDLSEHTLTCDQKEFWVCGNIKDIEKLMVLRVS